MQLISRNCFEFIVSVSAMYFAPLNPKLPQLYLIDHNKMRIASSEIPAMYNEVKLAYKADKAGTQIITLSHAIANSEVYLTDNQQSKTVQLKEGESYEFSSTVGVNEGRFALRTIINPTGGGEAEVDGQKLRITVSGDELSIIGAAAGEDITLIPTSGKREKMGQTQEGVTTISTIEKGVLMIRVGNEVVKGVKQ